MKEVQEKLLPGELGVSPKIFFSILPQEWGIKGVENERWDGSEAMTEYGPPRGGSGFLLPQE
jgi:hypothetical protein